ncbi:CR1L protein, partial [Locustella ochotensis]|nr:CR1L protein [Locustella ochotensis]
AALLGSLLTAALIVTVHSGCPAPPRLPSAEPKVPLDGSEFPSGYSIEYVCRPGFGRKPRTSNALVCGESGAWRVPKDICIPKTCSYPGDPENGRLVLPASFTFGSKINFTCNTGYRLMGPPDMECVVRNNVLGWSREVPICQVIPCEPPPEIANGQHTGTDKEDFVYGDSVTYRCHSPKTGQRPFSLVGEASIVCTTNDNENGVWSSPAPECKVVTCRRPRVENGRLLSLSRLHYNFGDSVAFECGFRYSLNGTGVSTCTDDDLWEPPLPVCQRSSCDDPPDVRNAEKAWLAGNLFPVDTVVTYRCQLGHQFSTGEVTWNISCLEDFVWSESPPPCQRVRCPDPRIRNGEPLYPWQAEKVYEYGNSVEVTCPEGLVFRDHGRSITLRCGSDGTWEPELPECVQEPRCPEPDIPHAREVPQSRRAYTVGTWVKVECEEGFALRGPESITCGADLSWKPTLPFCDKVCGPPPPISFGQHSGRDHREFPYGANVTYSCAEGLSLIGDQVLYCTSEDGENLAWSGPAPQCRGECSGVGGCPGRLTWNRDWTDIFSSLSPSLPTCQPVQCPALVRLEDSEVVADFQGRWYEVNETVSFRCKSEYSRTNYKTTCSADGTWTPPVTCTKSDVCERILQRTQAFQCGIPLSELKTMLEVQKLYLEIRKLYKDL